MENDDSGENVEDEEENDASPITPRGNAKRLRTTHITGIFLTCQTSFFVIIPL